MNNNEVSKFISLILRHKPEVIGISIDKHGWADTTKLVEGIKRQYVEFDLEILKEIVSKDSKHRYSFNEDMSLIRANQGHSINVDLELKPMKPPKVLYHGTAEKYYASIMKKGLIAKSRQYVHLSKDEETATNVGKRHGKPVVMIIAAGKMFEDGYDFYLSENGVWLTKFVPIEYIRLND